MDWSDTPEEGAFRAQVRRFLDERLPDYYRRQFDRRTGQEDTWSSDRHSDDDERRQAAEQWAQALVERRWIAASWPQEYGGAGLTAWEHFILKQEFAAQGGIPVSRLGVKQLGPTLLVHGTEEQKRRYLSGMLSAEQDWCQGYSEPGAGSDLASLQTRATRDGDEYVIRGQKIWTSNAQHADGIFILARTDPDAPKHRGISLFVIDDLQTPGISIRPLINMGWEHLFNETFFEDVRVPATNIVGEENRGWYVGMTLLDYERANIDSAVYDQVLIRKLVRLPAADLDQDAPPRHRLDEPTLRAELAQRHIEVDVALNFAMRVTSMVQTGLVPNYESSTSKMFGTELHQRVYRTGMKVFGLYANLWDEKDPRAPLRSEFPKGYLRSVPSTIAGGTSEIQRNIIATRGLGLPRG